MTTTSAGGNGAPRRGRPPRQRDESGHPISARALTPEEEDAIAAALPDDENDDVGDVDDDDVDGDVDDEGDEGGDEGGEAKAAAPEVLRPVPVPRLRAPARRAPLARPPPPSSATAALREQGLEQQVVSNNDLADFTSALDFANRRHKVKVIREFPEYWEGVPCSGTLNTYSRPISEEEIQRIYGGGTYRVMVFGPKSAADTRVEIKFNRTYTIVGDPIMPITAQNAARNTAAEVARTDSTTELMKDILDKTDRNNERMQQENKELRDTVFKQMSTPAPKDTSVVDIFKEMERRREEGLKIELEERKAAREADQRRFESKQTEDRMRWDRERETAKAEREEANRRHDKEMELARLQLQQAREDSKASREDSQRNAAIAEKEKVNSMQTMLAMFQSNNVTMMAQMQENAKQSMAQMQNVDAVKTSLFTDLLKNSKKETDPLDQLTKLMSVMETVRESINPTEPEKDTFEKVRDTIKELAPTFAGAVSAFQQSRPQGQGQMQQAQVRIAPGSVATVDIPRDVAKKSRVEAKRMKPPERAPMVTSAAVPPPPFKFPAADGSTALEEQGKLLGEDLEMGLQRGYTAQQLYVDVVVKFPSPILDLLKAMPVEQVIETINSGAPGDSILGSFKGVQVVKALHRLITGVAK